MQCSFCGGEINLSVGRCTSCGRPVDETSELRLTRDIHELAEHYGIKSGEEKQAEIEALPSLLQVRERDPDDGDTPEEDTGVVYSQGPTLGRGDYERLLTSDSDESDEGLSVYEQLRAERERARAEQADRSENIWDKAGGLITRGAGKAAEKLGLRRLGSKIHEGAASSRAGQLAKKGWSLTGERLVAVYNERFPQLKRVKRSTKKQRVLAGIIVFVLAAAAIMIVSSIASSIAPGVRGEWLITETGSGEKLTWEFTGGGKVIVRTYTDGEPHVYRTGTYEKRRRNDHNMLTITYEDGTVTRLYYEISHGVGTFTNVDSNRTAQYKRID